MENRFQNRTNQYLTKLEFATLAVIGIVHLKTFHLYGYFAVHGDYLVFQILPFLQFLTSAMFYFQIKDYIKLHLVWNLLYFAFLVYFVAGDYLGFLDLDPEYAGRILKHVDKYTVIRQAIYIGAVVNYLTFLGETFSISQIFDNRNRIHNQVYKIDLKTMFVICYFHIFTVFQYVYNGYTSDFLVGGVVFAIWQLITSTLFLYEFKSYIKFHLFSRICYFAFCWALTVSDHFEYNILRLKEFKKHDDESSNISELFFEGLNIVCILEYLMFLSKKWRNNN